ncbi:transposase [Chitinibacter fontanus]|uniref:Transposase n=1 Tax=Chitinibacter fontanus TaxID=1737446 RepID=A0A7D5VAD8_9NEIS|nr:transposase [Chitinibacter fontanus]
MIWLDPTLKWAAEPTGKRGRNPTFSDAAIQFCLTIKCLSASHCAKPPA